MCRVRKKSCIVGKEKEEGEIEQSNRIIFFERPKFTCAKVVDTGLSVASARLKAQQEHGQCH